MFLELEFEELENAFELELEQVTEISDGGFDRGFAEGYAKGDAEGQEKGRAEGEEIGYNKGYEQGNTYGYTTGKTEGMTEGFADALAKRTDLVITKNGTYTPYGSTGFKSVTANVQPTLQSKTVTPRATEQTVTADNGFDGLELVTVNGDTNLVAENIAEGVSIFGVTGTHAGGGGGDIDALIEGTLTELTSGATSVRDYAFRSCTSLVSANFPNVTTIGTYAFHDCNQLTSANFPKATSIGNSAFRACSALINANLPNATSVGDNVFYGCKQLTSANFPKATSIEKNTFRECAALKNANLPNAEVISDSAFYSCGFIEAVDTKAMSIEAHAFYYCASLKCVILRSETVCTLANTSAFIGCHHIHGTVNSTYNPTGARDGYIYVPRALVVSYKSATNWSTYSTQFRALEDYTVDGTITGALDPNKI